MQTKEEAISKLVEFYRKKLVHFKDNLNNEYLSEKIVKFESKREKFIKFLNTELDLLENNRDFRIELRDSISVSCHDSLNDENNCLKISDQSDDSDFADLLVALFLEFDTNKTHLEYDPNEDLINSVSRRGKVYWTSIECAYLIEGVKQHGLNWAVIYEQFKDKFHTSRTPAILASRYNYMKSINRHQDEHTKYKINKSTGLT